MTINNIALQIKNQVIDCLWLRCLHNRKSSFLYCIPQIPDSWVRCSPPLYNIRKFFLCQSHIQRSHCNQCIGSALISQCKCRYFPFLSQGVLRVSFCYFFNRYMEHLGSCCLINLSMSGKYFIYPCLSSKPGNHSGFNCRKIRNYKLISF